MNSLIRRRVLVGCASACTQRSVCGRVNWCISRLLLAEVHACLLLLLLLFGLMRIFPNSTLSIYHYTKQCLHVILNFFVFLWPITPLLNSHMNLNLRTCSLLHKLANVSRIIPMLCMFVFVWYMVLYSTRDISLTQCIILTLNFFICSVAYVFLFSLVGHVFLCLFVYLFARFFSHDSFTFTYWACDITFFRMFFPPHMISHTRATCVCMCNVRVEHVKLHLHMLSTRDRIFAESRGRTYERVNSSLL